MEVMSKTLDEWMTKAALFNNQWRWMIVAEKPAVKKTPRFTFKGKGRNRTILTEQEKEEYRKNGKCFNCGKQGHRSFECPDKKDKGKIREVQTEEKDDPKGKL